jgi:hypothetical protein
MSPLALVIALLALVVAAAGAGYAAATIGTAQLKNNAVTSAKIKKNAVTTKKIKKNAVTGAKVKDGSLTAADLVPDSKQIAATLLNGGEGDCLWQGPDALLPGGGLAAPAFRKDRFGVVHLTGLAVGSDGPGGDATCDSSDPGQAADAIVFQLPAGYAPAKSMILGSLSGGGVIIVGANGLNASGLSLPAGAVAASSGTPVILDGFAFDAADNPALLPKVAASGRVSGDLAKLLGIS